MTVVSDEKLNPIELQIDSGNKSDMKMGEEISDVVPRKSILIADKGYSGEKIREKPKKRKIRPFIPYKKNSTKKKKIISKSLYRKRNVIERFFLKLKKFRRINTKFKKLSNTF